MATASQGRDDRLRPPCAMMPGTVRRPSRASPRAEGLVLDETPDVRLADLVRSTPTLHPDDSLSRALHQLRLSPAHALPVVSDGQLLGVLAEVDLLEALHRSGGSLASGLDALPVAAAMTREVTTGSTQSSIASAWETMATGRIKLLPILDTAGRFAGVVSRNDLLAALNRDLRPRTVGGLATPLGVYLTTGDHRAGAGDLGLFLTGVVMALCHLVVVNVLEGFAITQGMALPAWPTAIAEFLLYLFLLRLTPLAGFHAAEHQVVHSIERGEPLVMRNVMRQPREHPRCGTNLVALIFGAQLLLPIATSPAVAMARRSSCFWHGAAWAGRSSGSSPPSPPPSSSCARRSRRGDRYSQPTGPSRAIRPDASSASGRPGSCRWWRALPPCTSWYNA